MAVNPLAATGSELRTYALGFPGAYEEFPWGERAFKVAKKMFAIMNVDADARRLSLTVKLGDAHDAALAFLFASPTGYNLGRSGWVTSIFEHGAQPPTPILRDWIFESYTLVAPKRLRAELAV
jgi:predicted DNA-binding protein (MmcQ/YjbR family)